MSKSKSTKHKSILTPNSVKFLYQYLNNASPTGFESAGQKIWLDYLKPYIDEYFVDTYGTAVGVINPNAAYKVVIEAHADEISWFVHLGRWLCRRTTFYCVLSTLDGAPRTRWQL